ncbi:replication-associated recombination protein A [Pseudosulfitobacter pseudonitzschiae]|uniref:Replication-associated recombination protein A n=1 Tax=Pseudosulfitobacter pseudonitzschiae TaxID=1402135 RepID=A0A073J536_9RHOB|nr:replication-associated recombination protein A [Pseudosulfitobacter pseudonitzschiae]KEJ96821.1 ATPase AAA [Pseudosulfitobacter pseudonitzschiae]MBM1817823.1 replication-associated recombination protein A [Pseudosulfitobacter pseudonitzschiae]MBM1834880.1 replication-associated recombination protein A [Pseudosulfitobacter pseudonitzschiae]MBM1839681.1 replication-associated recombination protein A [Pseudosulfitobacter pseudonitzschiae]MBM1844596.1 replication-associated recombination protei
MADLFDTPGGPEAPAKGRPLADRLRPARLDEVIGQDHILGPDAPLGVMLAGDTLSSLIFWGPPGVGKTTIARLLAGETDLHFVQISAIFTGVQDLKKVFESARIRRQNGQGTLLFVDEIHRFNKAQQDGFLPHMEDGTILLVGATTENPSFELNAALMSRSQVLVLQRLELKDLELLAQRAEQELGRTLPLDGPAREALLEMADGDGRALLNLIEQVSGWKVDGNLGPDALATRLMRRAAQYDKSGEHHYNLISALHKSVRGSDPDAALYWFARMLEGGEDPRYLARRITRMAVEDIGLADPNAQAVCLQSWETYERLGSPEGELALAQALTYLALAPKSNAAYVAYKAARQAAKKTGSMMPPKHILNAPTGMMKDQGYGSGYAYDHDAEDGFSGQNYFPDGMKRPVLYNPVERGFERDLKKRLDYFVKLRAKREG